MTKFELKEEEFATRLYINEYSAKTVLTTVKDERGRYLGQYYDADTWWPDHFGPEDIVGYWEEG